MRKGKNGRRHVSRRWSTAASHHFALWASCVVELARMYMPCQGRSAKEVDGGLSGDKCVQVDGIMDARFGIFVVTGHLLDSGLMADIVGDLP